MLIFSLFESHLEYLARFFNTILYQFSCCLQCRIPLDFLFLGDFDSWSVRWVFLKQKNWYFFALDDKYSLNPKVFMTIELLSKMWWKQTLGTGYGIRNGWCVTRCRLFTICISRNCMCKWIETVIETMRCIWVANNYIDGIEFTLSVGDEI